VGGGDEGKAKSTEPFNTTAQAEEERKRGGFGKHLEKITLGGGQTVNKKKGGGQNEKTDQEKGGKVDKQLRQGGGKEEQNVGNLERSTSV